MRAISVNALYRSRILEIENLSDLEFSNQLEGENEEILYEIGNIYTSTEGKSCIFEANDGFEFYSNGNETDVKLPENYKGNSYAIYSYAFAENDSFYTVKIPQGVTEIGQSAFSDCSRLAEIFIPKTVKAVRAYSFANCYNLYRAEIEDGVEAIETGVFDACLSLSAVALPNGLKTINAHTFSQCFSLTRIEIPSSVETIKFAFYNCNNLKTVVLNEGVKELIGAFGGCERLESINLPSTLITIGSETFEGCNSLERLVLPLGLLIIEREAFDCESLTVYYLVGSNIDGWENGWDQGVKEVVETGHE